MCELMTFCSCHLASLTLQQIVCDSDRGDERCDFELDVCESFQL